MQEEGVPIFVTLLVSALIVGVFIFVAAVVSVFLSVGFGG